MTKPAQVPTPFWGYYFQVDAIGAAMERLKAGGGTVINGPMEEPAAVDRAGPRSAGGHVLVSQHQGVTDGCRRATGQRPGINSRASDLVGRTAACSPARRLRGQPLGTTPSFIGQTYNWLSRSRLLRRILAQRFFCRGRAVRIWRVAPQGQAQRMLPISASSSRGRHGHHTAAQVSPPADPMAPRCIGREAHSTRYREAVMPFKVEAYDLKATRSRLSSARSGMAFATRIPARARPNRRWPIRAPHRGNRGPAG